jgi:putative ABC transport system permease protein
MFSNHIKHNIRSFKWQHEYTVINIHGLLIGIACSLIIPLFVINELSYENFNLKKSRRFRLILNGKSGGQEVTIASFAANIGPIILKEAPQIEDFLRMNGGGSGNIEFNNQRSIINNIMEADSSFFYFFSIPVLKGNPKNLLNAPQKVVLLA